MDQKRDLRIAFINIVINNMGIGNSLEILANNITDWRKIISHEQIN